MGLDYTLLYKTLSETSRRRILAVLEGNECSVQDIQDILSLGQSSISAHLSLLRSNGFVDFRRQGRFILYRLTEGDNKDIDAMFPAILESLRKEDWYERDIKRVKKLLDEKAQMSLSFYEGVETQNKRSPGQTDHGLAIGLLRSIRNKTIVDIGCGIGNLAREFAKMNNTVVGIDTDKKQIAIANKNIEDNKDNILFVEGKGEETGQKNNSVDIVLFSHSLHHMETPHIAIKESNRILKKGGMIIVLDLKKHEEFWMRKIYGDVHMGFVPDEIESLLLDEHFKDIFIDVDMNDKEFPQFETIIITAEK